MPHSRALGALGHNNQTEAFPARLSNPNGNADIFNRPGR
jgi:hypothetical protein